MRTSDFDFELPNELIASHPLERRDASRMLVVGAPGDWTQLPPRGGVGGTVSCAGGGHIIHKHQNISLRIRTFAQTMRQNMTPQEKKFWYSVNNKKLGFKFCKQYPIDNKYIADFICLEKKLIVEIDGSQHIENKHDDIRTKYLQKFGFNIVRFFNWDIDKNLRGCLEIVYDILTDNSFEKRLMEFEENLPNIKLDSRGNIVLPPTDGKAVDSPAGGEFSLQSKFIKDFISYLQPGDVVVFNNSRVIPARFDATASDGKKYEITLHTNKSEILWFGLCKKFNKLNIGDELELDDGTKIKIIDKDDESGLLIEFQIKSEIRNQKSEIFFVLDRVGKMPLPPYMNRDDAPDDRERYQTVYANPLGSMAAPTAGLHFTDEMLNEIENRGARIVNITLHVGAGTWMPVKTEDLSQHKMHSEWGEITEQQAAIINAAKRVIAIGTTSLRLLESAATKSEIRNHKSEIIRPFSGTTDIFITPGYKFKVVDVLLTNFHLPKSTLLMLVSAFAGTDEIRAAYKHAVAEKYRFFSYGDCCLLFKKDTECH